jgi:hypothetical protein
MRATIQVKEKFKRKWIIPLIIFIGSIIFEYFLGNLLFYHSHDSIMSLQDFMSEKIGLSIFNNTYNRNEGSKKVEEEQSSAIFCEIIQILNSNIFYVIICAIVSNLVNVYKVTVLIYTLFLGNFISATLSFILHVPRPFMSYFSIKPAIMYNDWGSPDNRIVVLISFYLTFYEIIIRNEKMDRSILGKIIIFSLLGLLAFLDIFFVFSAGDLGYNQIIFSVCIGIVTYQSLFFFFKVEVNKSKQLYNFLKFKISYYLFINLILLAFQIILFLFIIDKWDEDYFKNNIDEQQDRIFYPEFFRDFYNYRKNFYLDKGNFNNVICFLMNIVSFLALKLELFWTFKGDYQRWSTSNFEKPKEENNLLDYSDEDFVGGDNTQWNHTGLIRSIIRLVLTIILCFVCLLPTIILYAWFKVKDNDINGFICITALPLILMVFGIFYLFKPIFRLFGLAQKK